jgi:hypothetical protein
MYRLSRRSLLAAGFGLVAHAKPQKEDVRLFATPSYKIRMSLEFYDNRATDMLRFRERFSDSHFCFSADGERNRDCISKFNGSIAIARYALVTYPKAETILTIREYVRSIDSDGSMVLRPPWEKVIEFQHGMASDIQAFGLDPQSREVSSSDNSNLVWMLLRQDLFLNHSPLPFLILHWKHTPEAIRLLDVIPGRGTWQVSGVE